MPLLRSPLTSLCVLSVVGSLAASEQGQPPRSPSCSRYRGPEIRPVRLSVGYTSPEGIGYRHGYTTLEGFAAIPCGKDFTYYPLLDLRGHLFDDGKFAANGGLGFRYLKETRVYGVNAYYDYRNTTRQGYQQIGAGLECLGAMWDFRINGCLPVGEKQSYWFDTQFSHFKNNSLFIKRKRDYAMKGVNAEAGLHIDCSKNALFYLTAGPYYLNGGHQSAWGGEMRLALDLFQRYLQLEGNGSYDSAFKWVGQGRISVNVPLGRKCSSLRYKQAPYCHFGALGARALQTVDRREIIPLYRGHKSTLAINPATKEPWVFWFVDNTSHSAGTYENPFSTLSSAQLASSRNHAIYVFPGNGTSTGMNEGIQLKDNQQLLGASVAHKISTSHGSVTVPAMATGLPHITNTTGNGNVITAGNSNTVSGFYVTTALSGASGIFGSNVANLLVTDNFFTSLSSIDTNGVYWSNSGGFVNSKDNTFNGLLSLNTLNGNGFFVDLDAGHTLDRLRIADSVFSNLQGSSSPSFGGAGIYVRGEGTLTVLDVVNSEFRDLTDAADGIYNPGIIGTLNFNRNILSSIDEGFGISDRGTLTTLNVIDCQFLNDISTLGKGLSLNATEHSVKISGTRFETFSIGVEIKPKSSSTYEISNCSFDCPLAISAPITAAHNFFLDIQGNTFSPFSGASTGYAASVSLDNASASLCVDFTHNTAPTGSPVPYAFTNQLGSFNLTPGSNSTTNQGQFSSTGSFGSCTP